MSQFVRSKKYPDWGRAKTSPGSGPGDSVELEYFINPAQGFETVEVEAGSLISAPLERQDRVYVLEPDTGRWRIGRLVEDGAQNVVPLRGAAAEGEIVDLPEDGEVYLVKFPKIREKYAVRFDDIYVPWEWPIESPVPWLATKTHGGKYMFQRRLSVLTEIIRQRAGFAGMTGLASASIELLEHQVMAMKTVLHDPIMRYVLADEVGLGKTIEAGVVIRQHILDEPANARVLVLAPPHLVQQWKNELAGRINLLRRRPRRWAVGSYEELESLSKILDGSPSMVVVDEAHQAASLSGSELEDETELYAALAELAHTATHVLLLSATPVLRNEAAFLAMLHLLDPEVYELEKLDEFKDLVHRGQNWGSVVAMLTSTANSALLRRCLTKVEELSGADDMVHELANTLEDIIEKGLEGPERNRAISQLRLHIQEVYRPYNRLIRASRDDPGVALLLPRRKYEPQPYEDPGREEAFHHLEDWRLEVLDGIKDPDVKSEASDLFVEWVEASLIHPSELQEKILIRLGRLHAEQDAPFFDHESELLEEISRDLEQPDLDRAFSDELISDIRQRSRGLGEKVLVFTSSTVNAEELEARVASNVMDTVLRFSEGARNTVQRFTDEPGVGVLIIDQDGEEGLNLQRTKADLVHADLPLSPIRLEQRLGRIDRMQCGEIKVVSSIPYANSGYERAVFEFLKSSGVFTESVAPLQYILNEVLTWVRERLLEHGTDALDEACNHMIDPKHEFSLEAEKERHRHLRLLDQLDQAPENQNLFQSLEDYEFESAGEFSSSIKDWLGRGCLNFWSRESVGRTEFGYSKSRTLMSLTNFNRDFGEALAPRNRAGHSNFPEVVFDRDQAVKQEVPLLRVGHPLVNCLERQLRKEERGMACAIWRCSSRLPPSFEPSVFFRFEFLIEASIDVSKKALHRRADRVFPPKFETVWINGSIEEEGDQDLLNILEVEIGSDGRAHGIIDKGLHIGHTWDYAEDILAVSWDDLCERAEEMASRVLGDRSDLAQARHTALDTIQKDLARGEAVLQARKARLSGASAKVVDTALETERTLAESLRLGVEQPSCELKFVAAIFLSPDPLPPEEIEVE